MSTESKKPLKPEPEHKGSIWLHPYFVYVWLTVILFGVLLIAGKMALTYDWLPKR